MVQRKPLLIIFTFHRILTTEADQKFLQGYERGLPLADFERQIAQIASHFRIIDLDKFTDIANGDFKPRSYRPLAMLTFDDADSDHLTAFDTLAQHNLPGVSFVPTGFIDTDRRFYHLRLTNICNQLTDAQWQEIIKSDIPPPVATILKQYVPNIKKSIQEVRRSLIPPFHQMEPAARDNLITTWENRFEITYDLDISCLSWDEIIHLPRKQIALGSHTKNHNRLTLLTQSEALTDLIESRKELTEKSGLEIKTICYPEGSFDADTPAICQKAGYDLGFTIISGLVDYPIRGDDRFLIPRVGIASGEAYQMSYSYGVIALKNLLRGRNS